MKQVNDISQRQGKMSWIVKELIFIFTLLQSLQVESYTGSQINFTWSHKQVFQKSK